MSKRIAIVGSGISGLVCANLLSQRYNVSLFESNSYLGGHTHTVDVNLDGLKYAIDTGFIVFNQKTYPNFCKLLLQNNIAIQKSEMSFSYRCQKTHFEYNGHSLNTLFSDRKNLFRPRFYRFIAEILKFNKDAKKFLNCATDKDMLIESFIHENKYSRTLTQHYILPMMASIWSKNNNDVLQNSARFILQFYENHGLLDSNNRPEWYVIAGGSRNYIPALIKNFRDNIFLNTKIEEIERKENQVLLKTTNDTFTFDGVVIATHSDQALGLLKQPTEAETAILSKFPYNMNEVTLHTDTGIMPKKRLSWASWNYFDNHSTLPSLTYYMNRLQSLRSQHHFCVSVNLNEHIDKQKIIKQFRYAHPCFNQHSQLAQAQHSDINGKNNTYYAGAYWGYGFHEDGVKSAIKACEPLGVSLC